MEYLPVIITVIVSVGVFLVLREFFTWYWKMNEISTNQVNSLKAQVEIIELLEKIEKNTRPNDDTTIKTTDKGEV